MRIKSLVWLLLLVSLEFIKCDIPPVDHSDIVNIAILTKIKRIFENLSIISIIFTTNDKFPSHLMSSLQSSSKFNDKNFIIFNLKKNFVNNLAKNRNQKFDNQFTKYWRNFNKKAPHHGGHKQVEDYLFENLFDEDFVNDIFEINKQIYFTDDSDDLEQDSRKDDSTLVNSKLMQNLYNFYKRIGYIVIGLRLKQLKTYFESFITSTGTYLFIIEHTFVGEQNFSVQHNEEIFNCLQIAWRNYNCFNLFLLIDDQIFTYAPFAYDAVKKSYGKIIIYNGTKADNADITLMDLNGYPLTLEIFPSMYTIPIYHPNKTTEIITYYGPDAEVANILKEEMNFTVVLQEPDQYNFGYKLPNGSFTGTIGRLGKHKSDMAITGFFVKDYLSRDIEFTSAMYTDQLCCIVKKASQIPQSILPLLCYDLSAWLFIFLLTPFCAFIWIILRKLNQVNAIRNYHKVKEIKGNLKTFRTSKSFRDLANGLTKTKSNNSIYDNSSGDEKDFHKISIQIFVDTVILMLSAPLRKFPAIHSERIFVAAISIISLVFVSLFQSSLATVFIKPMYYKDITTLKQLDDANYIIKIKYKGYLDDLFPANASETVLFSLRKKLDFNAKYSNLLNVTARSATSIATVTRKSSVKLDNAIFFTNKQLFLVNECPRNYNLAYVLPKNSIFLERVNSILLHCLNGGLIYKWINDMEFNTTMDNLKTYGSFHMATYKILTVIDLQLPFYILAIGFLLSGTSFAFEYYNINFKIMSYLKRLRTINN